MDSTLLGMNGLKWERGNISLLLKANEAGAAGVEQGGMYIIDHDNKTAANARNAFTKPKDKEVIAWVTKLLTQKQKVTDFWSRDTRMTPVLKQGMISGFASRLAKMTIGDLGGGANNAPKGRVSDTRGLAVGRSAEGAAASPSASSSSADEEGDFVHVENPSQARADAGVWADCYVYELKNLCVRELTNPPVLAGGATALKATDWWKPEYSREATAEEVAALGASGLPARSVAELAQEEHERSEKGIGALRNALQAIRSGRVNESNAASVSLQQLEGMGAGADVAEESSDPAHGHSHSHHHGAHHGHHKPSHSHSHSHSHGHGGHGHSHGAKGAAHTVQTHSFEDYFGQPRPRAAGEGADCHFVDGDGFLHRPTGKIAEFKEDALIVDDKSLDCKLYFTRQFPISIEQFLPVADIMARTGSHAENMRRFFMSKFPKNAGFPVRFTIPVFPTITATVTFESCETRRAPSATLFDIPADYKCTYTDCASQLLFLHDTFLSSCQLPCLLSSYCSRCVRGTRVDQAALIIICIFSGVTFRLIYISHLFVQ
jgi:hypothetical protein